MIIKRINFPTWSIIFILFFIVFVYKELLSKYFGSKSGNKSSSYSEDLEKQDKVEDISNSKQHFRFDIPKWSHGETCKQGDSRFECKSCKVKVKLRSSLLPLKQ